MDFIFNVLAKIFDLLPDLDLSTYVNNAVDKLQFFSGILNFFIPFEQIFTVGKSILTVAVAYFVYAQIKRIFFDSL
ncbi:MAG: hypothetical protein K6G28_04600 [Acholeplasmatales bacterium]|nr:hypothetical protein [Acholeplasmatales bacterium]